MDERFEQKLATLRVLLESRLPGASAMASSNADAPSGPAEGVGPAVTSGEAQRLQPVPPSPAEPQVCEGNAYRRAASKIGVFLEGWVDGASKSGMYVIHEHLKSLNGKELRNDP